MPDFDPNATSNGVEPAAPPAISKANSESTAVAIPEAVFDGVRTTALMVAPGIPTLSERWDELCVRNNIVNGAQAPLNRLAAVLLQNIFGPFPCYQDWNRQQIETYALQPHDMRHPVSVNNHEMESYNQDTGEFQPSRFQRLSGLINEMIASGLVRSYVMAKLNFSEAFRDYQPEAEIILTEGSTIMRVTETRDFDPEHATHGAPVDIVTLYSWPGGTNFYWAHQEKMDEFINVIITPRTIDIAYAVPRDLIQYDAPGI